MLKINPVRHQLINVTFFVIFGKLAFNINITWSEILASAVISIVTELLCQFLTKSKIELKPSSLITALAICISLRSANFYIIPLVTFLGIIQKYALRQKDNSHLFNPSNIAILLALILFPNSSKLDLIGWDFNLNLIIYIFASGLLLLYRVKRLQNYATFLLSFFLFKFLFWPISTTGLINSYLNPTLLLLSFFIINDPKTTPKSNKSLCTRTVLFVFIFSAAQIVAGMKDIFIPLSLVAANLIIRFLDHKKISYRYAFSFIVAATFFLYISPYNIKKNFSLGKSAQTTTQAIQTKDNKNTKKFDQEKTNNFSPPKFHQITSSVFEAKIHNSKATDSNIKFHKQNNSISNLPKKIFLDQIGDEFSIYASIGSIDINQDFLNDVILTTANSRIEIFINEGNHTFSNRTQEYFDEPPKNIEEFKVIDLNSDTYEDIFVIFSKRDQNQNHLHGAYHFNPQTQKFDFNAFKFMGKNKFQSSSLSFTDINKDNKWDIYLSYGMDWRDPSFNQKRYSNEFWVSTKDSYNNKISSLFNDWGSFNSFASMTNVFSKFNNNAIWMFHGNDLVQDPSLIYQFSSQENKFNSLKPSVYPVQSAMSMSFFPIDFDNDGVFELWENAVQNPSSSSHNELKRFDDSGISTNNYYQEMGVFLNDKSQGNYSCNSYKNELIKEICNKNLYTEKSNLNNDNSYCLGIKNKAWQATCKRQSRTYNELDFKKVSQRRISSDKVPKVRDGNTILKWDKTSKKLTLIEDNEYQNTGWAWSSYPFDINLDGKQDLYITSNFFDMYQGHNHLLINKTDGNNIKLRDETLKYNLNYSSEYRGLLIDDYNNDCSGDIIINSFIDSPLYLRNRIQGDCIKLSLRYKEHNYWSINSIVKVYMKNGNIQTREILLGGIWGVSQSKDLVIGISNNQDIDKIEIQWPNDLKTQYSNIKKNHHYLIFFDTILANKFKEQI